MQHRYQDLIRIFEQTFFAEYQTRLVKGDDEPVYLPADKHIPYHRIIFAHGYYASALHEIAHWCVAGAERRKLEDYGYWYCPDGRNAEQQAEFEKVEVKPQAIEWAFSAAAQKPFRVSTDNLNGAEPDREAFTEAVRKQALTYLEKGFPNRVAQFIQALREFYQTPPLTSATFSEKEPACV
ncbi:elongation factor P hydroxylase [Saliniradius amylolyticus]|uniref:elongation factor P hydroxylase n=1 Tax=Saliniradius amylolyticus TaxID=2183582 RepID=UPI0019509427|nr:elongation factor P hydroxylase [Saliniradius amylolyticus]